MNVTSTKANVEDIIPSDDAFHGSPKRGSAEWWYFDAIFNNNYSAHIGFQTFTKKNFGMVSPKIHFYKNGKFIVKAAKRFLFKNIETSKNFPIVKILGKPVFTLNKELYKQSKDWVYDYKFKIKDNAVDLKFKGLTKGWKIETENESWTVALPKAFVTGEIVVNGKKMDVKGIGYHDHNWNYNMLTVMNYGIGWYWGKIISKSFSMVFANIVKSKKHSELITVINHDNGGYLNINPNKINFSIVNTSQIKYKKYPTEFRIKINDIIGNVPVNVDITMESKNHHFAKQLLADYWRYHVESNGEISVGSKTDRLDNDIQIIEYLKYE
jgi:predicted secreted hydrolase